MSLPDDEKVEYLASLPTEIVWKMAEGNPENKSDVTSNGQSINFVLNNDLTERDEIPQDTKDSSPEQETV